MRANGPRSCMCQRLLEKTFQLMQDYYELLQVHPRADAEVIQAAYERLRVRYDPARMEGAADELQQLARQRRDEIALAYTVLSDRERRAAYDSERAARATVEAQASGTDGTAEQVIDYRPLPPARRQERPEGFNAQAMIAVPHQAGSAATRGRSTGRKQPMWLVPSLLVAVATFGIVLGTLLSTALSPQPAASNGPQILDPNATAAAPTPTFDEVVNQFEGQLVAARQVAAQVPDNPNAWTELGNALYDSVIVVRERLDRGEPTAQTLYVERLPRWLEAADAYRKALALEPGNSVARADLATSLCYYGQGINDQSYVQQGLAEAQQAVTDNPEEGRALLSAGICYILGDPPQTEQALEQWQRLVVLPGADPNLVFQARQLVQAFGQ